MLLPVLTPLSSNDIDSMFSPSQALVDEFGWDAAATTAATVNATATTTTSGRSGLSTSAAPCSACASSKARKRRRRHKRFRQKQIFPFSDGRSKVWEEKLILISQTLLERRGGAYYAYFCAGAPHGSTSR